MAETSRKAATRVAAAPSSARAASVATKRKRSAGETPAAAAGKAEPVEAATAAADGASSDKAEALPQKLTRKEQHKLQMAARFDKQLKRIEVQHRHVEKIVHEHAARQSAANDGNNAASGGDADRDDGSAAAPHKPPAPIVKLRHDPMFAGGSFWRTRKEQKARTLFVGNIPAAFNDAQTKATINQALKDSGVQLEDVDLEQPGASAVQSVDFLFTKPRAATKHAYVVMATMDAAYKACDVLNGLKCVDRGTKQDNRLRVNFSSDKSQRAEAIAKREGSKHLPHARGVHPQRGGATWRGGGFGGGRGSFRGPGGGRSFTGGRGRAGIFPPPAAE